MEARKCGQLVAEIYREVQVVLIDCGIYTQPQDGFNDPPTITTPFIDPFTGLPTYETTVYAGQLVQFNIEAEDIDTYNGGILSSGWIAAGGFLYENRMDVPGLVDYLVLDETATNGKIAIQKYLADDVMVYASYATATKGAGVNAGFSVNDKGQCLNGNVFDFINQKIWIKN